MTTRAIRGGSALAAALFGVSLATLALAGARAETAPAGDVTGALDAAAPAADLAPAGLAPIDPAATPPATSAAPAAGPALPADPLSTAVIALLATDGAGASLRLPAADRAALFGFYTSRNGAPAWIADGRFTPQAETARTRIAAAADDALDPARFAIPAPPVSAEPAVLARADVALSAATLAYARQAWGGRVNPALINRQITVGTPPFDAAAALLALAASPDVAATLDGFNPAHPEFQALRRLLAASRAERASEARRPIIAEGRLLKPGAEDDRVPALRVRLGLPERADDVFFDEELASAVQDFQRAKKLGVSGLVNRQTLRALNAGARTDPTTAIQVNMERWRWMPRDLGAKHVFVDLPAFRLHIVEGGRETYETRVIIGKAAHQTPMLSSAINQIVVNPYWNVPVSIAMNELSQGSLRGYEVVNAKGQVVSSVDWASVKSGKLRIRQAPGERNALGHIKFLFPNRYSVYLHDTSSRKLFANDDRALSHGCVRVDKPLEFADALSGDQGLSGEKLQKMVGGKERGLPLATTIPVHLTYFTARVGADGALETRPDIYDQDGRVRAALAGEALPALPPEPVIASAPRAKPKVARRPTAQTSAEITVEQRPQRAPGFGSWLSRMFGDSRQ